MVATVWWIEREDELFGKPKGYVYFIKERKG
jgi:hypothetical protein